MRWRGSMMGDRVVERSVLQVPARFEGGPDSVFLQLDTGSDQTMLYEVPYREVRPELSAPQPRFVHDRVKVGPADASGDTFWIRPGAGRPLASTRAQTIGTPGADSLRHRVLVLDFPNLRFALLDTSEALPRSVVNHARWTPLTARDRKLFVPGDGCRRDVRRPLLRFRIERLPAHRAAGALAALDRTRG